jgi:hypothetical protein
MDVKSVSLRHRALDIALSYNGIKEETGNRGKFVDDCLKLVGVPVGNAWCQAFIYRVYNEAAIEFGVKNPVPRVGGVLNHWRQTKGIKLPKNTIPQSGDIAVYDHGKGLGHIAIVVSCKDGLLQTIEGNTSLNGSRNGDGVYVLNRRRTDDKLLIGYIRY